MTSSTRDQPGKVGATIVARSPDESDVLERALRAEGVEVYGVVPDESQLEARAPRPDVVVLASRDTAKKRADRVRHIRALYEDAVSVIVVAAESAGMQVHSALQAGASGYVLQAEAPMTLGLTVRAACAGLVAVPQHARRHLGRPSLSPREKQVLGLVVLGFMNSEIAGRLHLTESTVKSHLSSIFSKLGVRSRHEAVDLVLDPHNGLGPGILSITEERSSAGSGRWSSGGSAGNQSRSRLELS